MYATGLGRGGGLTGRRGSCQQGRIGGAQVGGRCSRQDTGRRSEEERGGCETAGARELLYPPRSRPPGAHGRSSRALIPGALEAQNCGVCAWRAAATCRSRGCRSIPARHQPPYPPIVPATRLHPRLKPAHSAASPPSLCTTRPSRAVQRL
jgi:hypothetical protein